MSNRQTWLRRYPFIEQQAHILWTLAGGVSIRTKILGIILALTIILGLGITLQVRTIMAQALLNELDNRGEAIANDLALRSVDPLLNGNISQLNQLLLETLANHPDGRYAIVIDINGRVLSHTYDTAVPPAILELNSPFTSAESGHIHYENFEGQMHDFLLPIKQGELGYIRLGLAETRVQEMITQITIQMLITTLLVALIGVLAATALTWLLTRPILELVVSAKRVSAGNLSARAPHWADDEIGDLADAFNDMVHALETSQQAVIEKEAARTRLLAQLINVQEEERKRIARELHDDIGQALTSQKLGLKLLSQTDDKETANHQLNKLRDSAADILENVRLLSRQLRPSALDDLGLSAALERYTTEFSQRYPNISVDLHCSLPNRLPNTIAISLYRIIQEAMTNAARHSEANALSVLVSQRGTQVQAIIEDNGVGFNPESARRSGKSVGLHGMSERAELLGGKLEIESSPGNTTVYIEVPL